jgi:hypothetical protein
MLVRQGNRATKVCGVLGLTKEICNFSLLATGEKESAETLSAILSVGNLLNCLRK